MNLKLPQKQKIDIKPIILYVVSILVCIIAGIVVIIAPYIGDGSINDLMSMGAFNTDTEEIEYTKLKVGFNDIFKNQLENHSPDLEIKKEDESKDIIYTYYEKTDNKEGMYNLNLHIPYINIDDENLKRFNEEIKETFENKAKNILSENKKSNTIYSVEYEATIEDNILYLIIRSNLKEASNAQRIIIQTYNYDLQNGKEITLEDILSKKGKDIAEVQNKIKEEVSEQQQRGQDLKNVGYDLYQRDVNDKMYNIENTEEFFVKDGIIYIIYAYGNENLTSEMDLIIVQ